jgi:hypothetical protein
VNLNVKQKAAKRLNMAERAQQQMDVHFPDVPVQWIWRRKKNDGFSTIPRTMPIAMQIIDAQAKGHPAGHTLFCLWARSPDHPVVAIENPATFAAEAGFTGERAVDTWRRRMKKLRELNFIATKPGSSGEFHYVLLLNPNAAIEWMRSGNMVQDGLYTRFIERAADIGAHADVEAIRQYWAAVAAAQQAQAAIQEAATRPPLAEHGRGKCAKR